jgi:hypothetical protein
MFLKQNAQVYWTQSTASYKRISYQIIKTKVKYAFLHASGSIFNWHSFSQRQFNDINEYFLT